MEGDSELRLSRVSRLVGSDTLSKLQKTSVILFGLGGVGSWAAECLVRTGIKHLTIVDADIVAESNINRQLPALVSTIGKSKVEVMRRRLLEIAPDAVIHVREERYNAETAAGYDLAGYDYVIDAIDSLSDKALLILEATAAPHTRFFSSMGAAMKLDPSRIQVAEFWKVKGCPLAAALRRKFKKSGNMPRRKFKCVFSDELVPNSGEEQQDSAMTYGKVAFNGAICHITAIFGMMLASLVINDVVR